MARGLVLLLLCAAACGPTQVCLDYVACQQAYDDDVDVTAYQEGGACWGGSLPTADACDAQCSVALAALAEVPSPPPACVIDASGR